MNDDVPGAMKPDRADPDVTNPDVVNAPAGARRHPMDPPPPFGSTSPPVCGSRGSRRHVGRAHERRRCGHRRRAMARAGDRTGHAAAAPIASHRHQRSGHGSCPAWGRPRPPRPAPESGRAGGRAGLRHGDPSEPGGPAETDRPTGQIDPVRPPAGQTGRQGVQTDPPDLTTGRTRPQGARAATSLMSGHRTTPPPGPRQHPGSHQRRWVAGQRRAARRRRHPGQRTGPSGAGPVIVAESRSGTECLGATRPPFWT